MRFSVGYRTEADESFVNEIIKRKEHISEVYFSWGNFPSGRNDQTRAAGLMPFEAQERQIRALSLFSAAGIPLHLLFNANCYGEKAQSRAFFTEIGNTVDYILRHFSLSGITTTSFLIAKFIKENFPSLEVRASVNMSIGTVEGMEYAADYFDSFYVQREHNRSFEKLHLLRDWCNAHGKEMYLLANSGCLNFCSAHTFHDNLVAHEKEIAAMDNGYAFHGLCREFLSKDENRTRFLACTNFIRPEDVALYEGLVPSMKLATRVHENPARILSAYIDKGRFTGNIASLLEPNHAGVLYPYILENSKIHAEITDKNIVYKGDDAFIRLEDTYANKSDD